MIDIFSIHRIGETFANEPLRRWGTFIREMHRIFETIRETTGDLFRLQAERDHRRKEANDAVRRQIAEALKEKEDLVKVSKPAFEIT